ncbi:penicillin-binding protein [Urechidicola vernalis]|uniref:Penicillin-binding protein n=1 Tax=Urechidicola vernalis TaxID=3075600 RepID=A0ABU2Y4C5_9FLAO|nr:penicillin-binding protein [Urechidicola sp. P050]MDT0552912.1 penicillin-binding protein [Urechidicola sp. P050]
MATKKKSILNRLYIVFVFSTLFFIAIIVKLISIQYSEDGDKYRSLSEKRTIKNDTIHANRGNVYADDGSLLATSMSRYEIRMDTYTVDAQVFEDGVRGLANELSKMFGKSSSHYVQKLRKARANKNRYLLIARNIGYLDYQTMKTFPIFNLGMYKGGFIAEQSTKREHPLGKIAERTIGYDDYRGAPGIEGAYKKYLRGKSGWRLKQRIAQGQWKPINDNNEVEPQDGRDVITTINVNIQDIAHDALLGQLEKFEAEHGSVIVMETKTGEVKAISNLARTSEGTYYEKRNYAVYEKHELGSTFKMVSMVIALEDKVIDTSTVVDTDGGVYKIYGRSVRDSHRGGYGVINAARAFEVSSNVGLVKLIYENYKDQPEKFSNKVREFGLDQKLGLPIKGEGQPIVPHPDDKNWSGISLPWMAYGYGIEMTPLQILTFYNAIANNGEMVKPRFIKEIRHQNKVEKVFEKEVLNPQICSQETIDKMKELMKNVVKRGTADNIYSPDFSMAGKTGTCQLDYGDPNTPTQYIASFAGHFPADDPIYSCMVVIHRPNKKKGYYGNIVAAPVFEKIAHKIYRDAPLLEEIPNVQPEFDVVNQDYGMYFETSNATITKVPNVKGMSGMDAISLLENLGLQVEFVGNGKVKRQSIKSGQEIVAGTTIKLELV